MSNLESMQVQKTSLQVWGFGEPHYYKNFPYCNSTKPTSHIQEASIYGEVEWNIPKINDALDDHQFEYQHVMVEFEGKIITFMSPF